MSKLVATMNFFTMENDSCLHKAYVYRMLDPRNYLVGIQSSPHYIVQFT